MTLGTKESPEGDRTAKKARPYPRRPAAVATERQWNDQRHQRQRQPRCPGNVEWSKRTVPEAANEAKAPK